MNNKYEKLRAALESRVGKKELIPSMGEVFDDVRALLNERDDLQAECEKLRKDAARLDWLADPDNQIGAVQLPRGAVMENLHCMRAAIDAAMHGDKT